MKKRIFAALLALCLTVLTGCDWSDNTDDIFGTLTDYYNVENKDKDKDVKLTSFALPYLKGETADPITCPDGAQLTLGTLLYEGLFALDGQFEAQPALAESYTYDASRYTYTITLRAASFSDGTSVTARDVVNALRRAQTSARYSGRLAEVSDIWVSNGAVRISLTTDNRSFVSRLDIPIVKSGTESSTFPIGTGPYAYSGEGGAHLAKNASWWQGKPLPLDRIELTACKDTDSVSYAFYAREIQLLFCDLTGADTSNVYGSGDYTDAATSIMQYLCLNTRRAPFDNPAVRRAVTLGVDRAGCVSAFLLGHGMAAHFPLSPASDLYPKELETAYSPDGYASALEAAGLHTGKTRSLTLLVNQENSFKVSTAQKIAAGLSQYDLQVTVQALPNEEYLQALQNGDFDLCFCEVKLTADWDLRPLLQSYASLNFGGYATRRRTNCWWACARRSCRACRRHDGPVQKTGGPGPHGPRVLQELFRPAAGRRGAAAHYPHRRQSLLRYIRLETKYEMNPLKEGTPMKQIRALEVLLRQHGLLAAPAGRDAAVTGICNDSRQARPGDLFICKGYGFKPEYLEMARSRGAVCALAETDFPGVDIPCVRVSDVRKAQSLAARWFYDEPSDSLTLIGVTGTKGKTTTSYMIQAITNALAGRPTGLSSSAGRYCGGPDVDIHLTTPESLDLQWLFAQARDHGLPYMTAEVSSQAYQVERVYGEHFDIGVFLNFSEDHISPKEHALWRNISSASCICWKTAAGR